MNFDLLDGYLLDGVPEKRKVIATLSRELAGVPAASPFLEGMRILGARTPDLSLLALRLVLAGKSATDESVIELKRASDAARAQGPKRDEGLQRYRELLAPPVSGQNGE